MWKVDLYCRVKMLFGDLLDNTNSSLCDHYTNYFWLVVHWVSEPFMKKWSCFKTIGNFLESITLTIFNRALWLAKLKLNEELFNWILDCKSRPNKKLKKICSKNCEQVYAILQCQHFQFKYSKERPLIEFVSNKLWSHLHVQTMN